MSQRNGAEMGSTPAEAHIIDIAEAAAERAVHKTMLLIGIDLSAPVEAQRTFATLHDVAKMANDEEFRRDLEHMRSWRKFWESARDKTLLAAIGVVVAAIGVALWTGFRSMVK